MFSALAIALSSVFLTSRAMRLRENCRSASARSHLLAADQLRDEVELLRADTRSMRATALASLSGERARAFGLPTSLSLLFAFLSPAWPWKVRVGENSPNLWPTMSSVTDRNVLVAVVDAEGQADELRQDGRAAAPDLDDFVSGPRRARLPPS